MSTALNTTDDISRLRWQCRRGMLELDLMLEAFIDKCYQQVNDNEKQAFRQLLGFQDQVLLDYLMGHSVPGDKDIANVAKQIRNAAGPDT